jgi:hypothetical protein
MAWWLAYLPKGLILTGPLNAIRVSVRLTRLPATDVVGREVNLLDKHTGMGRVVHGHYFRGFLWRNN